MSETEQRYSLKIYGDNHPKKKIKENLAGGDLNVLGGGVQKKSLGKTSEREIEKGKKFP